MMLLVFVIMVLNSAKDDKTPWWDAWGYAAAAPATAMGAVVLRILLGSDRTHHVDPDPQAARGTVAALSQTLFPDRFGGWSLLFLVVGLLLLSAIVGAVLLAKRHLDSPAAAAHAEGGH